MSVIERDLSLIILEEEYPKLKAFLEQKFSEMRHEAVMRAIEECSGHTFAASRILARLQEEFANFMDVVYNAGMAQIRQRSLNELEKLWKTEKRKSSLAQGHVTEYINNTFRKEVGQLEKRKNQFERDISVIKSLHKRLENRESLLQTYTRLLENRTRIIPQES